MQDNIKEEDPAIENKDNIKEEGDRAVNFDESDMLASTTGKFIKIAKIPTEKASIWNRLLDLRNLATRLFGLATAKENLLILRTSLIVLRR